MGDRLGPATAALRSLTTRAPGGGAGDRRAALCLARRAAGRGPPLLPAALHPEAAGRVRVLQDLALPLAPHGGPGAPPPAPPAARAPRRCACTADRMPCSASAFYLPLKRDGMGFCGLPGRACKGAHQMQQTWMPPPRCTVGLAPLPNAARSPRASACCGRAGAWRSRRTRS
jgi:hypothetical protein